jgi:hypothetical protein
MGLAPKLSLDYNSGAGNGMVGLGWALNGLPCITRDPTNGISYNGTDTYIGSNGDLIKQSDGTYHYQSENYSRIQPSSSTAGDGPQYWVETTVDGTQYYYGQYDSNSTSANVIAQQSQGKAG